MYRIYAPINALIKGIKMANQTITAIKHPLDENKVSETKAVTVVNVAVAGQDLFLELGSIPVPELQ